MCLSRTLVLLLAAMMPSLLVAQPSHYTFAKVADAGEYGGYFEPASIANRTEVLFAPATLLGYEGVFKWRNGAPAPLAIGGDPTPDGGVYGYTLSPVSMNENGDVVFVMTRDGYNVPFPTGLNAGVYRYSDKTGVVPVLVPGVTPFRGGVFWGSFFVSSINNKGDAVFSGMYCVENAGSILTVACPDGSSKVLDIGVFIATTKGMIRPVTLPGDPAPGTQYPFDLVRRPVINSRGDVAFTAHVVNEPCTNPGVLVCGDSLFVKRSPSGVIERIATAGTPSPINGVTFQSAYGPVMNANGAVVYEADIPSSAGGSVIAVFLYADGKNVTIAKPGDPMPGGGTFASGGYYGQDSYINNQGDIVFDATLVDGTNGIYLWRKGVLSLVAKTNTDVGVGVISTLDDFGGGVANTQLAINDAGQVLFAARFTNGGGAMLMATPH